jgi:hypothetical protein
MQFEYKSVKCTKKSFLSSSVNLEEFDALLNRHADQGWELVCVNTSGLAIPNVMIATFKREKQPIDIANLSRGRA